MNRRLYGNLLLSIVTDIENKVGIDELKEGLTNPDYLKAVAFWCKESGIGYSDFMKYINLKLKD